MHVTNTLKGGATVPNEKAPGAINTEGLTTDTTNDLNFATGARAGKAIAAQVAELAIRGHAVHPLKDGGFANTGIATRQVTLPSCKPLHVDWG